MPPETPMERLEAMAVDREVEAETIRGNKFRSHAYALEHELAASDLRWALSELRRLTADCARKDLALEPFAAYPIFPHDKPETYQLTARKDADGVQRTLTVAHFRAAAYARGEGSGR